ncbi:kinase-like domain-containing protein [Mycena vulgaris]|nr:kinase-like domain-containing protein [Mycena vulgaris]
MKTSDGLLVAVRQVELPTAVTEGETAADEEARGRRRILLRILLRTCERDVAMLKSLEHEHILKDLGSSRNAKHANFFFEYEIWSFDAPLAKSFVRQILHGLSYLHDRGIVHGGFQCAHIFVNNVGGIKLCEPHEPEAIDPTNPSNFIFWTAPEIIRGTQEWTTKADSWSLGCTVVEMLSADHSYPQLTAAQLVSEIGTVRPTIPSDLPSDVEDFLRQTFEVDSVGPSVDSQGVV